MTTDSSPATGPAVRRPNCSTCFLRPREHGSARCDDCGPGRIAGSSRGADDVETNA